MKTMSIIGLVIFPLGLLLVIANAGKGILGVDQISAILLVYAICYSVVGLIYSIKYGKRKK